MGLADFKSVGGNLIVAGGSIPSPSAVIWETADKLGREGRPLAEANVNLTAYSHYSG